MKLDDYDLGVIVVSLSYVITSLLTQLEWYSFILTIIVYLLLQLITGKYKVQSDKVKE